MWIGTASVVAFVVPLRARVLQVIGSILPWIECKLLTLGVKNIVTIDYGTIHCHIPGIKSNSWRHVAETFESSPLQLDAVVTYSSLEHSGLGRYGDPLNPYGDLEAMAQIWCLLKPKGYVIIGVPIGPDELVWNAHRIYGPARLKHLFANFRLVRSYCDSISKSLGKEQFKNQPPFILQKEPNGPETGSTT